MTQRPLTDLTGAEPDDARAQALVDAELAERRHNLCRETMDIYDNLPDGPRDVLKDHDLVLGSMAPADVQHLVDFYNEAGAKAFAERLQAAHRRK